MREPRPPYIERPIEDHLELTPSGLLPRTHDGSPAEYTYSERQRFTPEESEVAFTQLLVEQGTDAVTTKARRGPHQEAFIDFMADLQARLHTINPGLVAEHLAGLNYQSSEARKKVASLPREQADALVGLRDQRIAMLGEVAGNLIPHIEKQLLIPELLDAPPYYPSAHDWHSRFAPHGCANACFRMIHGGITG
jgi:hypothetical protein